MILKKLIPYDEYTLKTKLSFKEVKKRISDNIVPSRSISEYFFEGTNKIFEGYVLESTFKLNKLINGRKSFLPIIEGHLYIKEETTHIKIYTKTLYWRLLVFFFAGIFFFFVANGFDRLFNRTENSYIPLLLPIIVYLFTLVAFSIMNRKTKKFFIQLLEAERYK